MRKRTTWAAAWTLLIFALCWWPKARLGDAERGLSMKVPNADKLVHMALFAGYGWLWMAAPTGRRAAIVGATGLAVAILSELGQNLPIVNRDAELLDGLADAAGLALGVAAAFVPRRGPG